jgi:hypothetical protein
MIKLTLEIEGKRLAEVIEALKAYEAAVSGLTGSATQALLKQTSTHSIALYGNQDDWSAKGKLSGCDTTYAIFGVREDGSEENLGGDYPARGFAYASATRAAVDICAHGNPGKFKRLKLKDNDGKDLTEYNSSPLLEIKPSPEKPTAEACEPK